MVLEAGPKIQSENNVSKKTWEIAVIERKKKKLSTNVHISETMKNTLYFALK